MKKDKKTTTLVVTLAIAATMALGMCLIGCNEKPEYTVSFTGGGTLVSGTAPASLKKKEGEIITLPDNTFTYEGHTFAGWSYADEIYAVGDEFTVAKSDVEFVAQWNAAATYTVTYVGGEGATGTAPVESKAEGETVTLAAANTFTKANSTFVGWSDGTNLYAAGDSYTVGDSDVTLTAEWFDNGTYNESLYDTADIAVAYSDGKMTFVEVEGKESVYLLDFAGDKVTFVSESDSEDKYIGYYADGVIFARVTVEHEYFAGLTAMLISKDALIYVDDLGGSTGRGQAANNSDFSFNLHLYTNGIALYKEAWGAPFSEFGKYTKNDGVYSVVSLVSDKLYEFMVTPATANSVATFTASDGYKGAYKIGDKTIEFDGFGGWANGSYLLCSADGITLVRITDTIELTEDFYTLNGEELVLLSGEDSGVYQKYNTGADCAIKSVIYDGKNFIGVIMSGESDGEFGGEDMMQGVKFTDGSGTISINYTNYSFEYRKGYFTFTNPYSSSEPAYYTIGGNKVEGLPEVKSVENGTYVNNVDNTITATVSVINNEQILTLTKNATTTKYTVACTTTAIKFIPETGYSTYEGEIVNGVLMISGIKVGTSSTVLALTKTALGQASVTAANGYFVTSVSTYQKLYVFDGFAVFFTGTSSCRAGSCTINANNEVTINFSYKSTDTVTYKIISDTQDAPANFVSKDSVVGTYTVGSETIVLDGYGSYTKGSETGKYVAGSNGFTLLTDATGIGSKYRIGMDNVLEEVTVSTATEATNKKGNTYNYLKSGGIVFNNDLSVYEGTGCAEVSYTYGGNTITVQVVVGTTFTIEIDEENKVEFTVTGVTDSRCNIKAVGSVKIPQTDGSEDKVQSISGSMEWSVGGGAG